MLTVQITATYPGRWRKTKKMTWRRQLPESWEDIPATRRGHFFNLLVGNEENGVRTVLRHLLRLPAWALQAMRAEEVATLCTVLTWMPPRPDCVRIPFPSFRHQRITYHLPAEKGKNLCCLEYPLADDYYLKFFNTADARALLCLVAVLCREENPDASARLSSGDPRVPLLSRAEAEARADRLEGLEPYLQYAVLMYFAGLKEFIYKTYKSWIFEEEEDIDEDEEDEEDDEDPDLDEDAEEPPAASAPSSPDFGWWGTYQEAAEAGLFGTLDQVYQTNFHNVAMWLVRQRIKAEAMRRQAPTQKQHDDYL